jgi:[amino group carrier protein]-lysine/ornithine hydrolase
VRAFLAAIRKYDGTPGFTVKSGTSDMNITAPVWQCPTLAYGPGDSDLDHTPNEHILVSEYQRAVQVLADILRTLV